MAAIDAVEAALRIAAKGVSPDAIASKGDRDLVTAADVAAEDEVRDRLARSPGYPIVGEERGGTPPADGSPYWLLDPICGTTNFAVGLPFYCVNLALAEQGRLAGAVVGDPSCGEICVAEAGRGAWAINARDSRRLTVSDHHRIVVVEEVKAGEPRRPHLARFMAAVMSSDRWDFRSLSTTLGMAYLAAGRIGAYVAFRAGPVHSAAGSLLAQEAGATVTDIAGQPWTVSSDSLLAAATPAFHAELIDLVRTTQSS